MTAPAPNTDIIGQRFGRLTVKAQSARTPKRERSWACNCECGGSIIATSYNLLHGRVISCGCRARELMCKGTSAAVKHGSAGSIEYQTWKRMRARCLGSNNPAYPRYGGRGISICTRWSSFENFLADMGPRPSDQHSIDRIDNDGNYEPENCRWATKLEQINNRSVTRLSEESVREIRAAYAEGETQISIAKRYGLTQGHVGHVVRREQWKHV